MSRPISPAARAARDAVIARLCLACGICCNGVLFADVRLQPEDDADRLSALGHRLTSIPWRKTTPPDLKPTRWKFPQPCQALVGNACRIYADRPAHCRQFECALFLEVVAGETEAEEALRIIRSTTRKAQRVARLLGDLGNHEERLSLSKRFNRLRRQFDQGLMPEDACDAYAELTLAVQDLHVALCRSFYR